MTLRGQSTSIFTQLFNRIKSVVRVGGDSFDNAMEMAFDVRDVATYVPATCFEFK